GIRHGFRRVDGDDLPTASFEGHGPAQEGPNAGDERVEVTAAEGNLLQARLQQPGLVLQFRATVDEEPDGATLELIRVRSGHAQRRDAGRAGDRLERGEDAFRSLRLDEEHPGTAGIA